MLFKLLFEFIVVINSSELQLQFVVHPGTHKHKQVSWTLCFDLRKYQFELTVSSPLFMLQQCKMISSTGINFSSVPTPL